MAAKLQDFTVQDMIDRLMQVDDKSLSFDVSVYGADGFNLDCDEVNIIEYENSDGKNSDVALNIHLTETK